MFSNFSWAALLTRANFIVSVRPEALPAQAYVDRAYTAIDRLNADWYNAATGIWDSAWWNSANVVTMLADFTSLRLDKANELNIGGFMRTTFDNAQKTHVQTLKVMNNGLVTSTYCIDWNEGCMAKRDFLNRRGFDDFINEYYDDMGWWALAWIRSHDVTGDEDYLEAAIDLFRDMQTGTGTPCGGIYWKKDGDYVNAIANELYLSVSASLARRIPENGTYLEIAKNQWEWFKNSGMINKDNLINDGLNSKCENNGLQTWSYNQGVVLGGLVELSLATGDISYVETAHKIAKAAIKSLSEDGVLVETDDCEHRDGHCGTDGQQFKGIFVRNLRYLHTVSPQDEYRRFIVRNANSIWENNRDDSNRLGVSWTGPFVSATGPTQSSALDVLVAAIAVA